MFKLMLSLALLSVTLLKAEAQDLNLWVFFKDKGKLSEFQKQEFFKRLSASLPEHTVERRDKVNSKLGYEDIPVYKEYIEELTQTIPCELRVVSKWLNAVSIKVKSEYIPSIEELPFVKGTKRVGSYSRERVTPGDIEISPPDTQFYGPSWRQLDMMGIPEAHSMGYTGEGVIICMLDTGYELEHEALESLNVIAKYDFIFGDTNVSYDPSQDSSGQSFHGSITLGTIGGFAPYALIGPAYRAGFLLAKTEWIADETPVEEDYWVEGIEWADSMGADIVSSSLGYLDWYTYEDMNGDSAVTTKAADIAASHGILVVNAMGNEGNYAGSIIAPADADSIIAVGAVDSFGILASFSSVGPTYDGRTKPEVVAQGVNTWTIYPYGYNWYSRYDGTSLSTPLVAGAAALVLQAHPDWGPMEIREAIISTASNSSSPDNYYGWGIPDIPSAINYTPTNVIEENPQEKRSTLVIYSQPTRGILEIINLGTSPFQFELYDLTGRKVWERTTRGKTRLELPHYLRSGIYHFTIGKEKGKLVLFK